VASDGRKQELLSALRQLPRVRAEIETVEQAAAHQARAMPGAMPNAMDPPTGTESKGPALRKMLAERFPDQATRDALVLAAIEYSQQALVHGFALQRLMENYSAATSSTLSLETRREWRTMVVEHQRDLRIQVEGLLERMTPLTGDVSAEDRLPPAGSWPEEQSALTRDLQRMDKIVGRLMSGGKTGEVERDPASVVGEFQSLGARIRARMGRLSKESALIN